MRIWTMFPLEEQKIGLKYRKIGMVESLISFLFVLQ